MKFGSFAPGLKAPALHALCSDDVPLYFDMDNLTPKQEADFFEMCVLVSQLQVCLMGISKPEDYIAMFESGVSVNRSPELAAAGCPDALIVSAFFAEDAQSDLQAVVDGTGVSLQAEASPVPPFRIVLP